MQLLTPITILDTACQGRHEVKRSVFVAFAEPLADPAAVEGLIDKYRDVDARHHCWAWRCNGEYRFSDDGEPAGTAGRPILQAIEGADIDRTLVIVRRYFGGIKLGAGGLVRAYSAAATACLANAATRQLTPHIHMRLKVPFAHTQTLFQVVGSAAASGPSHTSEGVAITALVDLALHQQMLDELRNQTRGQIIVELGDTLLA